MFNSIEGYRGEPRQKPPFPTEAGLFGRPTVVNNVETLYAVLDVLAMDVGVIGVFSDWPATVSYYANCKKLK